MIIVLSNFHPANDENKHPIMDATCVIQFHPEIDVKKHPIMDICRYKSSKSFISDDPFWMILYGNFHPFFDQEHIFEIRAIKRA